jgi:hypothetical protein
MRILLSKYVPTPESNGYFSIIDGRQRVYMLYLLLAKIRDEFVNRDSSVSVYIQNTYFGPSSSGEFNKLLEMNDSELNRIFWPSLPHVHSQSGPQVPGGRKLRRVERMVESWVATYLNERDYPDSNSQLSILSNLLDRIESIELNISIISAHEN